MGFEPTTPSSPGECSTHWATYKGAALGGTRTHNTQQSRRVLYTLSYVQRSCPRWDSNPQHPAVQASALHTELRTNELPWVGLKPTRHSAVQASALHTELRTKELPWVGLEPTTPRSPGECSTHWATYKGAALGGTRTHNTQQSRRVLYTLSYVQGSCPGWDSNPRDTLQSRRVLYTLSYVQRSCPRWDSNPQHPAVQASALHTELRTKELP